jgi:carbonic anhydrase
MHLFVELHQGAHNMIRTLLLCTICLTFAAGCGSKKKQKKKKAPVKKEMQAEMPAEASRAENTEHPYQLAWGYEGSNGPQMWGDLKDEYSLCKTGKLQSPVNLKWQQPVSPKRTLEYDYKDTELRVADAGYTLHVKFPPGQRAYFNGKQFELKHIEFKTSSEHQLSGNQLPMEAQFVHENELGQIAILSVFIIEGQFNPFIEKVWSHVPGKKHSERLVPTLLINPKDLLPTVRTFYFYVGSLTTPPCSEGVRWHVLNTPLQMSRDQIVTFRKLFPSNSRPIQPLNSRKVMNY